VLLLALSLCEFGGGRVSDFGISAIVPFNNARHGNDAWAKVSSWRFLVLHEDRNTEGHVAGWQHHKEAEIDVISTAHQKGCGSIGTARPMPIRRCPQLTSYYSLFIQYY
jgi:hypothetical protein